VLIEIRSRLFHCVALINEALRGDNSLDADALLKSVAEGEIQYHVLPGAMALRNKWKQDAEDQRIMCANEEIESKRQAARVKAELDFECGQARDVSEAERAAIEQDGCSECKLFPCPAKDGHICTFLPGAGGVEFEPEEED